MVREAISSRHAWKYFIPIGVLLLSLALQTSGSGGFEWLRYDRAGVAEGELWRLLTGHLVHGLWSHYFLNAGALLLIWAFFPAYFTHLSALPLLIGVALLVSLALWWLEPSVSWYVGLSAG